MGNCLGAGDDAFSKERSAFDRVTSRTSKDDDCLLYQLADYQRERLKTPTHLLLKPLGGDLIKFFTKEGVRATEELLKEQIPLLLYNKGEGKIVTRADYLKWKYRGKKHVAVPVDEPVPDWKDHKACWNFEYRGSLGESLLHVLIVCNSSIHSKLARMLLLAFKNLALDVVEGNEFRGASALHLAIAYNNLEITKLLVEAGAVIDQRAVGTFFLPKDQQRARPAQKTDYEGLAYFGEFPLAWAACCNNEAAYNLLIDRGADPNVQDSFGNMVLHMVVVRDKLEMYGYALRHPRLPAKMGIINKAGYTPLSLSCHLGRATIFREMLELTAKEFWRYSNITCSAYPLNALDTILPDGRCNLNSALMIILNGTKEEHLDMLEGGIIQRLLEEKWKTFAQMQFLKRLIVLFIHLVLLSGAVYTRPGQDRPLMMEVDEMEIIDYARFFFEISACLSCLSYIFIAQSSEIKNLGFRAFLSQLSHNPAKTIFLISNFLTLSCIPCRLLGNREMEEAILIFSVPSAWFFLMFFAGAIRLTGPFVTMIYSMITGDMLTFAIIYAVMLLAFSQAFYFLHRGHPDKPVVFNTYFTTWMGLFQWTLGDYNYQALGETIYPGLTKLVFVIFMIMVPILLLNMLIAMMGNTYAQVIERSEKEWVKQWAKIVIALERAVNQEHAKEYLVSYSIKISDATDGSDGSPPQEQIRGVMVIKSKNKTRARQRKGALNNWKHVGRVTIKVLKKRGISGETLRKAIWDPQTPSTTSLNASPCMTPIPPCVPSNTTAAMLLMDSFNDAPSNGPRPGVHAPMNSDKVVDNAFVVSSAFNDLSGFKQNNTSTGVQLGHMPLPDPDMINAAIINKLALSPGFIEDVFEATYTPPMVNDPPVYNPQPAPALPSLPNMPVSHSVPSFTDHVDNSAQLSDLENEIIAQTLLKGVPPIQLPRPSIAAPPQQPPPPMTGFTPIQPAPVKPAAQPIPTVSTSTALSKDALPPQFRPKVLDSPTPSIDIADFVQPSPVEGRRRSSPGVMQHQKSKVQTVDKADAVLVLTRPPLVEEQPVEEPKPAPPPLVERKTLKEQASTDNRRDLFKLPPLLPRADTVDDNQLMGSYDPYLNGGAKRSKPRQKKFYRSNVVAPSDPVSTIYQDDRLPPLPDSNCDNDSFHRVNDRHISVQHPTQLIRSSTVMMEDSEPLEVVVHRRRRHRKNPSSQRSNRNASDHESGGSSSGVDERLVNVARLPPKRPPVPATSSSQQNTSSESSSKVTPVVQPPPPIAPPTAPKSPSPPPKPAEPLVFSISKDLDHERQESHDEVSPRRQLHEKLSPRRGGMKKTSRAAKLTAINSKLKKTRLLVARSKSPVRALSTTSSKIDQVKQDLFHDASTPAVTNLSNLLDDSSSVMAEDPDA